MIWRKKEFSATKSKRKNITKVFPSPKSAARNVATECDAFLQIVDISMTVSYTHLDVYKRQLVAFLVSILSSYTPDSSTAFED